MEIKPINQTTQAQYILCEHENCKKLASHVHQMPLYRIFVCSDHSFAADLSIHEALATR